MKEFCASAQGSLRLSSPIAATPCGRPVVKETRWQVDQGAGVSCLAFAPAVVQAWGQHMLDLGRATLAHKPELESDTVQAQDRVAGTGEPGSLKWGVA